MFLGVSRQRWLASGVLIVAGLAIVTTGRAGFIGGIAGIVIILLGIALFSMTPQHHAPPQPPIAPPPAPRPPAERPDFEARDASEV
jgi:hypothetical protein